MLCDKTEHFRVESLRHTCAIIMPSNQICEQYLRERSFAYIANVLDL